MKITICISDSGDERLARTLASLSRQTHPPDEVLIERRGNVAESRNLMFQESTGDVLVFIDTDQEMLPDWLLHLTEPLRLFPYLDFICGPTEPHPAPEHDTKWSGYSACVEQRHYLMCVKNQTIYPMGNTAWRRHVLKTVAAHQHWYKYHSVSLGVDYDPFDERFTTGGEDYDVNLIATSLGFKGAFAEAAWVWHDHSRLNSSLKWMQRKLRYCVGGAMAQLKNGNLKVNGTRIPRTCLHWLEGFQKIAELWGFLYASITMKTKKEWRA